MVRSLLLLGCAGAIALTGACAPDAHDDDAETATGALGTCSRAMARSATTVRNAPSPDATVVLSMDVGAVVDVFDSGANSGWARVHIGETDGWMKASLLECAEPRPTLSARRIEDRELKIDGDIEAAWEGAPAVKFDTDWSGASTGTRTSVRALWSERALYLLWELDGGGLNTDESRPVSVERPKLYEEDCVELFLAPDPAVRSRYFEIELGPRGHFFDLLIDKRDNTSDASWSSGVQIKTTVDETRQHVVIEAAIKSPDVARSLRAGANLPINLFRMEGKGTRQYLAWSPTKTPRPNFHVPEAFGSLILE